jgi:hypothetical protein
MLQGALQRLSWPATGQGSHPNVGLQQSTVGVPDQSMMLIATAVNHHIVQRMPFGGVGAGIVMIYFHPQNAIIVPHTSNRPERRCLVTPRKRLLRPALPSPVDDAPSAGTSAP